jgi:hypothetical protein
LLQSAALLAGAARSCREGDGSVFEHKIQLIELTAREVVERLRRGDLSAESYARHVLDQCEAHKDLNAFISLDADQVPATRVRRTCSGARVKRSGNFTACRWSDSIAPGTYHLGTEALRNFRPSRMRR